MQQSRTLAAKLGHRDSAGCSGFTFIEDKHCAGSIEETAAYKQFRHETRVWIPKASVQIQHAQTPYPYRLGMSSSVSSADLMTFSSFAYTEPTAFLYASLHSVGFCASCLRVSKQSPSTPHSSSQDSDGAVVGVSVEYSLLWDGGYVGIIVGRDVGTRVGPGVVGVRDGLRVGGVGTRVPVGRWVGA